MSYILSICFKNLTFRKAFTKYIIDNYEYDSLQYFENYEWVTCNETTINQNDFDQIQFHFIDSSIVIVQNLNNSLPRIYAANLTIEKIKNLIEFIQIDCSELVINSYINDYQDYTLNREEDILYYKSIVDKLPSYVKLIPNPRYVPNSVLSFPTHVISLESLPGHSHIMGYDDKLWFGSCWQMYYAPIYYKYIPKPLWDNFTDCFEHTVFDNGLRKIVLFENPEDFDLDESRAKQWSFRRRLGVDSIAHELTKSSNRVEPDYLPVLITKQDCKLGQTKVTRYLTKDHQLAMSEDLVEFMEVKEYLEDGITVVDEFLIPW